MDTWKYFGITHANHVLCNPIRLERLDEVARIAELPRQARILDIACGKAEQLCRLVELTGGTGVGVDLSPVHSQEGRDNVAAHGLASRIEIIEADGASYGGEAHSFDLVCCVGASWVWQGHTGTLAALKRWAKPGARILVGEPHWLKPPPAEYLECEGLTADEFMTLAENVRAGEALGLVPLYTAVSSPEEFDHYEAQQWNAAALWAAANPEDPDRETLEKKVARTRDCYLRHGRDTLGWALHLFMVPTHEAGEPSQ